jgi:hypothetical protein
MATACSTHRRDKKYILLGRSQGKRLHEKRRHRCEVNIKTDLDEVESGDDCIYLA